MPTDQPNNAPVYTPPQEREKASVGAVMADERLDEPAGGGGLGGASAADPLSGTAAGEAGAASPNSPIDATRPEVGEDGGVETEAQVRALEDDA